MRNIYLETKDLEEVKKTINEHFKDFFENSEIENIPVSLAKGRVSSEPIYSKNSVPSYNACAMDGAMVYSQDTVKARLEKPIILNKNQYELCDTGDPIIEPFNSVILIEELIEEDDGILIKEPTYPWENVRTIGEDIIENDLIYTRNHCFRAEDLAVLIGAGVKRINVYKKPIVSIIPTGDEIVPSSEEPKYGELIDTNSIVLKNLIEDIGAECYVTQIVRDNINDIKNFVKESTKKSDIVCIIAGSSAGRDDYSKQVAEDLGTVLVHGINIKPGKPAIIADIDGKPFIGIPGYPIAAYIVYKEIIQSIILEKSKFFKEESKVLTGLLSKHVSSTLKAEEYINSTIGKVGEKFIITPAGRGSGNTQLLSRSDGFIKIPKNCEGINANEEIEIHLQDNVSNETINNRIIIMGSHDMIIDSVNDLMYKKDKKYSLISSHIGSMNGLKALKNNNCHLAPSHLLGKDGSYNNEAIEKFFPNKKMAAINVVGRRQGIILPKDNPRNITDFSDLVGKSMINRQKGAGTRVLFDSLLEKYQINKNDIIGYENEVNSHLLVALGVKNGLADFGVGIESAAHIMDCDFLYLSDELYEFILYRENLDLPGISEIISILKSSEFANTTKDLVGYSTNNSGEVRFYEG